MSGICGVWSLDGGDPDLDPVLAHLERRGPDGTHRWAEGPIALGHTSLATTPEALVEVLPLTEPDGGCTITADARIDNREELIAALGLSGETQIIGDGELILRAYLKWSDECPTHLLGDFAFAIWDPRVAFAIPRVAARLPWRADCMVQALAAKRWLSRHGITTTLTLGVPRDMPSDFEAHAWLTAGTRIVTGGDISGYVPLARP